MTKHIQMPTEWDYFADEGRFLKSLGLDDETVVRTGRINGILHLRADPTRLESLPDETKCGQSFLRQERTGRLGERIVEFGVEIWSLSKYSPSHKLCAKCVARGRQARGK